MQSLPIGISEFTELREKNAVYVDKTRHVYQLITKDSRTFLSRPRRFGKSLFVSTLESALQGKKELFKGLWIARSDYSWDPYAVIRLDFSQLNVQNIEDFQRSLLYSLVDVGEKYGVDCDEKLDLNTVFKRLISSLSKKFKSGSVAILIDEYDYPILQTLHKPTLALEIRELLKNFSAVIKGQSAQVRFVFVTGVSAFSKSSLSSGLNNLKNLTMNGDFFDVCGYSEEEVDLFFPEHIKMWANKIGISYQKLREDLKSWYNGYRFEENAKTVYSPFSLTCALDEQKLLNFWFESATPQFLLEEFAKVERKEECKLLELEKIQGSVDLLQTFEIESLPLPALLFQMGYLTIDSYDPISRNYTLKYPNLEVRASLSKHLVATLTKQTLAKVNPLIGNLYKALVEENSEEFTSCLSGILSHVPYFLHIEEEKYYHSLLQTILFAAGIDAESERLTSGGRMDLFFEISNTIYVLELKINKSAEAALKQIESKKYYEPFLYKNKSIICLGVAFSRKKSLKKNQTGFDVSCAFKKIPC